MILGCSGGFRLFIIGRLLVVCPPVALWSSAQTDAAGKRRKERDFAVKPGNISCALRSVTGRWAAWWRSTGMWVRGWGWISAKRAFHSHGTSTGNGQPVAVCLSVRPSASCFRSISNVYPFSPTSAHSHTETYRVCELVCPSVGADSSAERFSGPDTKRQQATAESFSPWWQNGHTAALDSALHAD